MPLVVQMHGTAQSIGRSISTRYCGQHVNETEQTKTALNLQRTHADAASMRYTKTVTTHGIIACATTVVMIISTPPSTAVGTPHAPVRARIRFLLHSSSTAGPAVPQIFQMPCMNGEVTIALDGPGTAQPACLHLSYELRLLYDLIRHAHQSSAQELLLAMPGRQITKVIRSAGRGTRSSLSPGHKGDQLKGNCCPMTRGHKDSSGWPNKLRSQHRTGAAGAQAQGTAHTPRPQ